MQLRVMIDTFDADKDSKIRSTSPFTLNVFDDDDSDSTINPGEAPLEIHHDSEIKGDNIPAMLRELADAFERRTVLDLERTPVPATADEWYDSDRE